MKKVFLIFSGILIMTAFTTIAPKKIIFFGDSITQAGVGPKGYITMMKQRTIATPVKTVGIGLHSGRKVTISISL